MLGTLGICFSVFAPIAVAAASLPQETPRRLALLIGIDEYDAPAGANVTRLKGAVADVLAARALLVERFGFEESEIAVLTNELATHRSIVQTFDAHLLQRARPETSVVVWWSGHGSRVRDESNGEFAEPGGLDSSLVAFDSRRGDFEGEYDFVDDELAALLQALGERTTRVVAVIDACHSGGSGRGSPPDSPPAGTHRMVRQGTRAFDRTLVGSFWPLDVPLEPRPQVSHVKTPFAIIAACSPERLAWEVAYPGGTDVYRGAFSIALIAELSVSGNDVSLRTILERTQIRLAGFRPDQVLCPGGDLDRTWLGDPRTEETRGFAATCTTDDELRIAAGTLHGLRRGDSLSIFDATTDHSVGIAQLVDAGPAVSRARLDRRIDGPNAPISANPLRAEAIESPERLDRLRLLCDDPRVLEHIDFDRLRDFVRIEPNSNEPESLRLAFDHATRGRRLDLATSDGFVLWTSSSIEDSIGEAGTSKSTPALTDSLLSRLRMELRWREITRLAGDRGTLRARIELRAIEDDEPGDWIAPPAKFVGAIKGSEQRLLLTANDSGSASGVVHVGVRNTSEIPVYVALLDVSDDRSVSTILPPANSVDGALRLDPGALESIPIAFRIHPAWRESAPQRDRLIAICTTRPADFRSIEQAIAGDLRRGASLPAIVRAALDIDRRRGQPLPGASPPSGDEYGIANLDLLLHSSAAKSR